MESLPLKSPPMELPPLSSAPLKKTPDEKADEELSFNFLQRHNFRNFFQISFGRKASIIVQEVWNSSKTVPTCSVPRIAVISYLARDSFDPVKNSPGGSMIVKSTFFFDIFELHTKPFERNDCFLFTVLSCSSIYVFFKPTITWNH